MKNNDFTDPTQSLEENIFDWASDKKTGTSKGEIIADTEVPENLKDVTPALISFKDSNKESLSSIVKAYNAADVATQLRFVEILVKYDKEKVTEAMNKTQGLENE